VPGKFIHFVWMNDESCMHDSSKGEHDPCYRAFKNLKDSGKIEKFKRPPLPKGYVVNGKFGKAQALYPKFYDMNGVAQSQAVISIVEEDTKGLNLYKLEGMASNPDSEGRELELLKHILADAKKCGVQIEWDIFQDNNFRRHKDQAVAAGMTLIEQDEYWEVYRG
jgi:hypothetical protein